MSRPLFIKVGLDPSQYTAYLPGIIKFIRSINAGLNFSIRLVSLENESRKLAMIVIRIKILTR